MKIALVTTTINVPHVLRLYRAYRDDVHFFVAGDRRTPQEAIDFCDGLSDTVYLSENMQARWSCSDLIGWNCIQRRNIAVLEALEWGAEVIVTIDDDNIPIDPDYFDDFECVLDDPFDGLQVEPASWLNPGAFCDPLFIQRGFPAGALPNCYGIVPVVGAKVGVAQGMILGDPDTRAVDRLSTAVPHVINPHEVLRSGFVFKPAWKQWTVMNTQNTAFIRELAPAMFCPPDVGRGDDILASLITQRIMRERGLCVHFGSPLVFQQRNDHDLHCDLEQEMWIMRYAESVVAELDGIDLKATTVTGMVREIYAVLAAREWMPSKACSAALAFLDDCEKVQC